MCFMSLKSENIVNRIFIMELIYSLWSFIKSVSTEFIYSKPYFYFDQTKGNPTIVFSTSVPEISVVLKFLFKKFDVFLHLPSLN